MVRSFRSPLSWVEIYSRVRLAGFLVLGLLLCPVALGYAADRGGYGFGLYAGQMTANHWEEIFLPGEVEWVDAGILTILGSRRLGGGEDGLSTEAEVQLVKHFGVQRHWEGNLLGTLRWGRFPWDRFVDTSLAYGLGLSYATEESIVEEENNDETTRLLIYWMLEASFRLTTERSTDLILRIHHRSDAYGLMAKDGGSNAVAAGLRWWF